MKIPKKKGTSNWV